MSNPTPEETIAALDARLADLRAQLGPLKEQRNARIIEATRGVAGAQTEVDRLDGEVRSIAGEIEIVGDARGAAVAGLDAITAQVAAAEAASRRERAASLARRSRQMAREVDVAADGLIAAVRSLRESTKALWEDADGPTRREALGELPRLLTDVSLVINGRLAHGEVLGARFALMDRSAPPPSVELHLDIALRDIAPRPGRPANKEA